MAATPFLAAIHMPVNQTDFQSGDPAALAAIYAVGLRYSGCGTYRHQRKAFLDRQYHRQNSGRDTGTRCCLWSYPNRTQKHPSHALWSHTCCLSNLLAEISQTEKKPSIE